MIDNLRAQARVNSKLASAGVENLQAILEALAEQTEHLAQENASLKSSLHEALELLQRCFDTLDDSGMDLSLLGDINTLVYALRSMAEREKADESSGPD